MSEIQHKAWKYSRKELEQETSCCPSSNISSVHWAFSLAVLFLQFCSMIITGSLLFFSANVMTYALASGRFGFFFCQTVRRHFDSIWELAFVLKLEN